MLQNLRMWPRLFIDEYQAVVKTFTARALAECDGNVTTSARKLEVARKTMQRWMQQFELTTPDAIRAAVEQGADMTESSIKREYRRRERAKLLAALNANHYVQTATARALGISRRTLLIRLADHQIRARELKREASDDVKVGVHTKAV